MPGDEGPDIVPIDPAVREVLEEFSHDPVALANEIVSLRQDLQHRMSNRPPTIVVNPGPLDPRPLPPDAPPPIRASVEHESPDDAS